MDELVAADELKPKEVDGFMNIMGMLPAVNQLGAWLNPRPRFALGLDRVELRFGQDDTEYPEWRRYAHARKAISLGPDYPGNEAAYKATLEALESGTLNPTKPYSELLEGVTQPKLKDDWQAYNDFNHLTAVAKDNLLDSAAKCGDAAVVGLCLKNGAKFGPGTFSAVLEGYAGAFKYNTKMPDQQKLRQAGLFKILELIVKQQPACVNAPIGDDAARRLGPKATPICLAIYEASLPAVEFLLQHNVDPKQEVHVKVDETRRNWTGTLTVTPENYVLVVFEDAKVNRRILMDKDKASLLDIYRLLVPDPAKTGQSIETNFRPRVLGVNSHCSFVIRPRHIE